MLAGTELIRKKTGDDAYAMTITLLLNSEGKKMGKTAKGAVWLDPEKTSPYDFYQYWRNVDDADVMKCLRMLTFLPLSEIEEMEKWDGSRINEKKAILAHELTSLVHGKDEADKAAETAKALFSGQVSAENMPTTEIDTVSDDGIGILDLMIACNLAKSKNEARRLILQGGVTVDEVKVTEPTFVVTKAQITAGAVIKKGQKVFHRAILKG